VKLKLKVVQSDEFEKDERRLLNFGHTLGHALENQYKLMHGEAVAIGMAYAAKLSEKITGFKNTDTLLETLEMYGLPAQIKFNKAKVFEVLKMDKKRERKDINYILLEKMGKGIVHLLSLREIEEFIQSL
jgi:3-dehydroquinate synthase